MTKLPVAPDLVVDETKIMAYLLSAAHPQGRYKAAFFQGFGFAPERWTELRDALRQHAASHDVSGAQDTEFGTRYTVDGPLHCPDGRAPLVRSVWFNVTGERAVRLVTAYPLQRSGS
jgi:hypothetical protein